MSTFSENLIDLISEIYCLKLSKDESKILDSISKLLKDFDKKVECGEAIKNSDLVSDTSYAHYCVQIKNRRKMETFTFSEKLSDLEDLCGIGYFKLSKDERNLCDLISELLEDYNKKVKWNKAIKNWNLLADIINKCFDSVQIIENIKKFTNEEILELISCEIEGIKSDKILNEAIKNECDKEILDILYNLGFRCYYNYEIIQKTNNKSIKDEY
jgi:hypothetical protein